MKKLTLLLFAGLMLGAVSCQKELTTSDIIKNLTIAPGTVDADGSSTVTVTVELTDKAAADKRNIVFTATGGSWAGGKDGKVTVPATYTNGKIVAKATLAAPSFAAEITITAAAEATSINGDYQLTSALKATTVVPAKIHIEPTSLGIGANYASEDTLSAKISGVKGNNASKGVKVVFEDMLNSNSPAGGHFRQLQTSSDNNSKVSAIYGAPALPSGTAIILKVTVLDSTGNKTAITDQAILTIK